MQVICDQDDIGKSIEYYDRIYKIISIDSPMKKLSFRKVIHRVQTRNLPIVQLIYRLTARIICWNDLFMYDSYHWYLPLVFLLLFARAIGEEFSLYLGEVLVGDGIDELPIIDRIPIW